MNKTSGPPAFAKATAGKQDLEPSSPQALGYAFSMEIARERFIDDSRTYHLTIGVRSRTTEAHSLLTALTSDEREQVNSAIVAAMDQIERIVRTHLVPQK